MENNFKSFDRKHLDVAVALLLISLGAVGFYLLRSPKWVHHMTKDSFESESSVSRALSVWVGSLTRQKGNIRFRFGDSALWHEMENNSEHVNFGDALFTAKDGQALLKFQSGEQVEVMSNTLVVMKREQAVSKTASSHPDSENRPPLELKHGRLRLTLKKGGLKPVSVEVQGKRYEILPAAPSPPQNTDSIPTENTVDIVVQEDHPHAQPELQSSIALQVKVTSSNEAVSPPRQVEQAQQQGSLPLSAPSGAFPPEATTESPKMVSLILAPGESFSRKLEKVQRESAPESMKVARDESSPRKPASEPALAQEPLTLSQPDPDNISAMRGITPPPNTSRFNLSSPVPSVETTPGVVVSTASPTKDENELNLQAQIGYGVDVLSFSQSGDFGSIHGTIYSTNSTAFQVKAQYEGWTGEMKLSHDSVDFPTNNGSATENQGLSDFELRFGKGIFFLGINDNQAPVSQDVSGVLNWGAVNVVSPLVGVHLERQAVGRSERPYRFGLDIEASLPVSASGPLGSTLSALSGYGFHVVGSLRKALNKGPDPTLFLGLDVGASDTHVQYQTNWNGERGSLSRSFQLYQSLFVLELDL